jgi:hypothetical protein
MDRSRFASETKATKTGSDNEQPEKTPIVDVYILRGSHQCDLEGGMCSNTFPGGGSLEQGRESLAFAGAACFCCCRSTIREQAKKDFFGAIDNLDPKWHFGLFLLTYMANLGWTHSHRRV